MGGLAFGKEIATVDTALLNRQSNSCLRSPQKLKMFWGPNLREKTTSRGAIRFRSKAVPKKEADGREAAAQENAQRRKDYPTQARHTAWEEGTRTHNAHTETRQSNARRVLVSIYHATASYRTGQQGSKMYNTDLSEAKTLLKGGFYKKEDTKMCESVNV